MNVQPPQPSLRPFPPPSHLTGTNHSRRPGALHRVSGAGICHRRWRHCILTAMGRSPARVTPGATLSSRLLINMAGIKS